MTAQNATGTSTRQRHAAEQSARIEAARRAQIRRRAAFGGGLALIVLLLVGVGVLLVPRPTADQGHQVPIEGNRQHNAQGASIAYHNRPPSSGDHYDQPSGYGVFARDMPLGNLVHTLEHGGVVVYYRPDLCDQSCMGQLQQAYNSAPRSQRYGLVKMVVAPWSDMDQAVTAAAWGQIDGMDQPDVQRIAAFYRDHVDRGPEDALQIGGNHFGEGGPVLFSLTQFLVSAVVGAVVSLVAVAAYGRWSKQAAFGWGEAVLLAVVVGLSILLWRAAGNTQSLNDDPMPLVSPNDVLCPMLTYVCLGLYGALRRLPQVPDWPRVRALLTLVSFVVNVVTI